MEPNLTPVLEQQIVASIRAGGYAHVAAEAWGVSRGRFEHWLRVGRRKHAEEPYRHFAVEVRTAVAQARLRAEMALLKEDAKTWLEHGPGRERNNYPGWTGPVKAPEVRFEEKPNPFMNAGLMRLWNEVLEALTPYPDARASVSGIMDRKKTNREKEDPPDWPTTNGRPT